MRKGIISPSLRFSCTLFAIAVAMANHSFAEFAKNEIVELVRGMAGLKYANFLQSEYKKTFLADLPQGTKLKILEKKRMASGNWGFYVAKADEQPSGKKYWVYYNYKNPSMKLFKEKIEEPVVDIPTKKIIDAEKAQTIKETTAIDIKEFYEAIDKDDSDVPSIKMPIKLPIKPIEAIKEIPKPVLIETKNEAALIEWDQKITALYTKMAETRSFIKSPQSKSYSVFSEDIDRSPVLSLQTEYFAASEAITKAFTKRTNAEKCSTIDNRNDILGKPRNQDSVGWCFAFTATDLLSFKVGTKLSAIDTGLSFFQMQPATDKSEKIKLKSDNAGGYVPSAIEYIARLGACKESDLPSDDYRESYLAFHVKPNLNLNQVSLLEALAYDKTIKSLLDNIENYKQSLKSNSIDNEETTCRMLEDAQLLFPQLDLATILGATQETKNSSELIDWMQQLNCQGKRVKIPANLKMRKSQVEDKKDIGHLLFSEIDQQLNRGNILEATYHVHMFLNEEEKKKYPKNDIHSSIIVGRKFENGSCQYMIRNSWGTSCSYYNRPCEEGNVWVSEEDLKKEITEINYLPKSK